MAVDTGFEKRAKAYADAFRKADESERVFESKIEEFLISPEGGWTKAC